MHPNKTSPKRPPATPTPGRRTRRRWLAAAPLVMCLAAAYPAAAAAEGTGTSGSAAPASLYCGPLKQQCYSPRAYEVAYGVAPLLRRGIDGRGETVVVGPEPATTPPSPPASDIRKDLAAFDTKFGLPPARLKVVNTIAKSATPYLCGEEEITDTEMVHAMAPDASLDAVLVPANITASPANIATDVTKVIREGTALHAAVISVSISVGEQFLTRAEVAQMNAALEQARQQHVTVVDGSGDNGALSREGPPVQVSMPASDPLVLAVGGTALDAASPGGAYQGEMAWNADTEASGGGYSTLFRRPAYQDDVPRIGASRGIPDVAANADSNTGMALEFSDGELQPAPGTSASGPLWAAVIALADEQAGHPLGFVNPAIYAIARSAAGRLAFHDVTTGDNSVLWPTGVFIGYNAGRGWDPVTGWGSPDAQYLIPVLARTARSAAYLGETTPGVTR